MTARSNVAERVLTSSELVSQLVDDQRGLVTSMVGRRLMTGQRLERPSLAIVTTMGRNAAIQTYFRSKSKHAGLVGVGFNPIECEDEDGALAAIRLHNRTSETQGIVMQLPTRNSLRAQQLIEAVVDYKDVDALSGPGKEFYSPPTARAAVELARHYTNDFDGIAKNRVAVVGALGRLVGSGAVALLQEAGLDPHLIDTQLDNEQDARMLGRNADLIITATGQPGSITAEDLWRPAGNDMPLVIIDGGIGAGNDGLPAQDLDPGVFDLEYVWATKRTKAVGPLAVAYMFGNVIDAALLQTQEQ